MKVSALRIIASPAPSASVCDAVFDAFEECPVVLPVVVDADVDCAIWNAAAPGDWHTPFLAAASALRAAPETHTFLFAVEGGEAAVDEKLASQVGDRLGSRIEAVVRDAPASQWMSRCPIGLWLDGFGARQQQAGDTRAAAIEFGEPTALVKIELPGLPGDALHRVCRAAGSESSGLLHIGAYPGISRKSGTPFALLQCSDGKKSPLHRALALLDIEANRFGATIGRASVWSFLPLADVLGTLAARMPLSAAAAQVIETHLERSGR
ncbi:MAG: hypothetical protein JOY86_02750 [Candidatus Eremiobacteraeota bacterium]|nr:hypothetical protein [Candidatus Eremiobacteraeota bacterium]